MTEPKPPAKLGLWTSTALVVGNMIASGIFLLPATLATYGGISLVGWIGSSVGAIALALLYSKLSKILPNAPGGPYAYTRLGLGDFAAFLVAWTYWISIWCANAAIVVTFVSYLTVFFPVLSTNPFLSVGTALGVVWFLTWVNNRGIQVAGRVQLITTIMKLLPLVLVAVVGLFYVNLDHFIPFNASGVSDFSAISTTITLTLFAYLGLESATIPSESIHEPGKTIPRATMIGTLITMVVYVMGSITVMGMVPPEQLRQSNAPFADAAALIWGDGARTWVALGAVVSTFGALNGWIMLQGQIPFAAARDNMFPKIFKYQNAKQVPALGIVVGSTLISALIMLNFTKGLTETFTFIVFLGTMIVLVPYLFSAAAYGMIILQDKFWKKKYITSLMLAGVAFAYSVWAVIGSGEEAVYWGFIATICGIPFYVWMKRTEH